MAEKTSNRARIAIAASILLTSVLASCRQETGETSPQDGKMKSDVTIYLEGQLLERGGTVFVVPREVAADKWRLKSDLPNPALVDWRLDERKPIEASDRRLSVVVSNKVSIVRFDYPQGGNYNFRFLPTLASGVAPEKQGSVLVSVGSTYDYHPVTDAELFVPTFQVLTIIGDAGDEGEARALVSEVKLGYLEERYNCKVFENAVACNYSKGIK